MPDAPRDDLIRQGSPASVSDGRTMTGYPIVFDTWTTIDSWEGQFKERIAPGALAKTLRESKNQVKVLFNHGMDPNIGDKPLGKPAVMKTDDTGLYVEVPLSRTSYNDDLLALMDDGAIDGMSFRFSVVKEEWDTPKNRLPERTITELKLYELGPVTFPAYQATTVGVRSREDFASWSTATESQQSEIRGEIARILGHQSDLRTLDQEPGSPTLDVSRDEHPEEPPAGHSEEPVSSRAKRALRHARMRELGVIPHGQDRGDPVAV